MSQATEAYPQCQSESIFSCCPVFSSCLFCSAGSVVQWQQVEVDLSCDLVTPSHEGIVYDECNTAAYSTSNFPLFIHEGEKALIVCVPFSVLR